MAKGGKVSIRKASGSPNKSNARRQSRPKNKGEAVQAIADDIESAILADIHNEHLRLAMDRRNMRQFFGVGEQAIKLFEEEFESDYSKSAPKDKDGKKFDKDIQPDLKKINQEAEIDPDLLNPKKANRKTGKSGGK